MNSSVIWYSSSYVGNFADGDCRKKIDITKVTRDTVIHNRLCRVIGVFSGGKYLPESEVITFAKERKIFFYEDNVWKLLYDFSKQEGDTLMYNISKKYPYFEKMSVPSPFEQNILDGNPYQLVVKHIDTIFDAAGKPVRRFHTQNVDNTTGHSMGMILENVGSIHKLFGSNIIYLGPECLETEWPGLRCYSDQNSSLKFIPSTCDEITNHAYISYIDKLTIYPNPGHDQLTIQIPSDGEPPYQYQIADISGRVLELGSYITDHWVLSMDHLISGLYIIAVRDSQGNVWHGKWVKE